ncbi:helix-turn-helix domain-containing GNAT family N-acetyltransferase [Pseudonocardia sp. RS11V-5]|uniref:bifunctional helix-turn-helix transcriptional regulator/GNAT family N-acetyltransferase n=1 Tax=Pseudonocardia terrae TaxID=2905831 RepID=UPI001E59BFAE|nr:helix-turn-helix domain-containing GNAT family N-acetyltransferase [Pseudonocardia terrae]MCE3552104.1 helix-turn-helix domain-containing GNAT family N-acetyltransferase [Pseudonocardia terrae]
MGANSDEIAAVRRFHRAVVRRVGALEEGYLGRDRPLGQARLLWEIGPGAELRDLRTRLGLDSGYLSRMLRSLEAAGLVAVDAGAADARVRRVRLTAAGREERAELDRRSDALAASILDPLNSAQRSRLTAATAEVERLLLASTVRVAVTPPTRPEAQKCLRAYVAELAERFEEGFDPSIGPAGGAAEFTPPAGELLVAMLDGEPVGCVGVRFRPEVAEIKRMWVAPAARGLGLARRLLAEIEERARVHGLRATRLDTNGALVEAIALYGSAGYREVPPFNDNPYAQHWFAKDLDPAG